MPAPTPKIAAGKAAPPVRRRRRWLAGTALACALATAAGVAGYLFWWPRELCRQWESRVAAADDASLPAAVEGLDRCGRFAVRPLVGLLGSPRAATADAAEAALAKRIRRIRAGDGEPWNDAAELGETLLDGLHALPPKSQGRHVRLAMELLEASGRLSIDHPVDDAGRGRVIAACEAVLRTAPSDADATRFVARQASPLKPSRRTSPSVRTDQAESGMSSEPTLTPPASLPTPLPASPVGPTLLSPPAVETRPDPEPGPTLPRTAANSGGRVNPIRDTEAGVVRQASTAAAPAGVVPASPAAVLSQRTAWSLFADLTGGGPASPLADAELHRRGFRPAEIELGRQFASASAAERVRLAESLPSRSGIDIRPWLVHLCDDDDPAVRLAVVTIMATTNDPQMLARLRQIALSDSDEFVRLRAGKLTDTGRAPLR